MNKNKNETSSTDKKELFNVEAVSLPKDYLFQKYSSNDPNKNNLPVNSIIRTKSL